MSTPRAPGDSPVRLVLSHTEHRCGGCPVLIRIGDYYVQQRRWRWHSDCAPRELLEQLWQDRQDTGSGR